MLATNALQNLGDLGDLGCSPKLVTIISHVKDAFSSLDLPPSGIMEELLKKNYPDVFIVPSPASLLRELSKLSQVNKALARVILEMINCIVTHLQLVQYMKSMDSLRRNMPTQQPEPMPSWTNPKIIRFQVWDTLVEMNRINCLEPLLYRLVKSPIILFGFCIFCIFISMA